MEAEETVREGFNMKDKPNTPERNDIFHRAAHWKTR
jgi:hypothetical protein